MLVRTWIHPTMDEHQDYDGSRGYATAIPGGKQPSLRREKSGRMGSVLRKFLGRKNIQDYDFEPLPTDLNHKVSREFGSPTAARENRSQSLPANKISKARALRSHAPFGPDPSVLTNTQQNERTSPVPRSKRRLSLPGVVAASPEPFADNVVAELSAMIDAENIGFAVTSGGLSKRRSRSVDGLLNLAAQGAAEDPSLNRAYNEAIESWRGDIVPDLEDVVQNDGRASSHRSLQQGEDSTFYKSGSGSPEDDHIDKDSEKHENYLSYDFQQVATTINEQETIPIEERMMVAEVKLMDLEHAICKLQDHSALPPSDDITTPRAMHGVSLNTMASVRTPLNRVTPASSQISPKSGMTSRRKASTHTTRLSTSTRHSDDDPFIANKRARHGSVETGAHQPEGLPPTTTSSDAPPSAACTSAQRPVSLTSISIEHFTTLVTLLKREQHARIRLEDELAELRREVFHILHPSPGPVTSLLASSSSPLAPPPLPSTPPARSISGGSLYRQRRWDGSRQNVVRIDDFHVAHRRPSYEGDTDTLTSDEYLSAEAPSDVFRETQHVADPLQHRARSMHKSSFDDSDTESEDSDLETETETATSEPFATPIETVGRFEIAAGMRGLGEGEVF